MKHLGIWARKAWPVLLVASIIIALDQWTKEIVRENLEKFVVYPTFDFFGNYFLWQHVDNYGAAFGILQGQGTFFAIVAIAVSIGVLIYVYFLPSDQRLIRLLLGLQLGGAIGNLIDRLAQGYVTDFIVTGIPGFWYIPNYNIADSAIVCGTIGLGIYILLDDMKQQRASKEASPSSTAETA